MDDWTEGYVADINYTFGYYGGLNPQRVGLAFLSQGLVPPEINSACELGFGQGLSINLHAAGSSVVWHGTDFNPSQASFAQELASQSGSNLYINDKSFAEFSARPDLPEFDFIGLHGVWSWISDENRAVIVDFISKKLKFGGVLYISYNTMPGWTSFAPMRHLMTVHANVMGIEGHGTINRINGAIEFAEKLLTKNPLFARANPQATERLEKLKNSNRHYLAHEYFNRDWAPMHFATMADWLKPCKLQYACSASYLDHLDRLNLSADQQAFLSEIPDSTLKETTRDFLVNKQFRSDYWVKGARKLNAFERAEALRAVRVVLTRHREDVSLKVKGALGEAHMIESIYVPILNALEANQPKTIGQIEQECTGKKLSLQEVVQAVMVLIGTEQCDIAQGDQAITKSLEYSARLNSYICDRARGGGEVGHLCSPVTGGGFSLNRFQQLFLYSIRAGKKRPTEWAQDAYKKIASEKTKLVKDGKTLDKPEEIAAELKVQAELFSQKTLSVLKGLKIFE